MASDYFRFRQFTVWHDRCAMKVGTDGTLLGAWARGGHRILDIGTGTGLVALMMAQRFSDAQVTAVDIDPQAVAQARDNVAASPFAQRLTVLEGDVRLLCAEPPLYDAIVANPPYFDNSLCCPDERRTLARHTATLSYGELMTAAARLLTDDGELSVIVPAECRSLLEGEAALAGLLKRRHCDVRTTPRKPPRRTLLSFGKKSLPGIVREEGIIETQPGMRSAWYAELTKDFYL